MPGTRTLPRPRHPTARPARCWSVRTAVGNFGRLLVLVVAAYEIHGGGLIASLGGAIEDHQRSDELLRTPRKTRIRVKNLACFVFVKGAQTWQLVVGARRIGVREVAENPALRKLFLGERHPV